MARHPLDGNMIAADAHYNAPAAYDYSHCEGCQKPFRDGPADEPENDTLSDQDGNRFHLCTSCADC